MSALGRIDVYSDERALGQIGQFPDYDDSVFELNMTQSGTPVFAIYVMNDSGGTLTPGLGCLYKAGFAGKRVGSLHTANGRTDGIVDPKLSAAVPNGSYFWLILQGPIDVEIGTGGITAGAVVQTIANGKFAAGVAGTAPLGHSGISIEAANDGSRARVAFNNPFAAIQAAA
jgi:hypothetical protein